MKKIITTSLIALAVSTGALTVATTANATSNRHFTSTIQAPSAPVRINVTLGEDLAYRADNLSTELRDKHNSRSLRNGFSGNGYFGQRDLDKLTARLKKRMEARLEKSGVVVSDDASTVLNIVITDAKPNRPTFNQLSNDASLSMRSFGLGGAEFEGTLSNASGELGAVSYKWFETDIYDSQYGGTWTDANRAIDKFARKTAKALR